MFHLNPVIREHSLLNCMFAPSKNLKVNIPVTTSNVTFIHSFRSSETGFGYFSQPVLSDTSNNQLATSDLVIVFNVCNVPGIYSKVSDLLFDVEPLESNLPSTREMNFVGKFCNVKYGLFSG